MATRKQRLLISLQVQQLFCDLEDATAWIREKEPVAESTNRDRDLIGVQNLIKKHQAVLAEINDHENRCTDIFLTGKQMLDVQPMFSKEIKQRLDALKAQWNSLKEKSNQRMQELEELLQAHQLIADANEAESRMCEKEPIVSNQDYGEGINSSKALLKKHAAPVYTAAVVFVDPSVVHQEQLEDRLATEAMTGERERV